MEQEEKKQKSQAAENQASCSSLQPVAPHPFISVIPLAVLITLIVLVVKIFPDDALAGASQVALMIATAVCVALGMGIYRMKWNIFEEMIKNRGRCRSIYPDPAAHRNDVSYLDDQWCGTHIDILWCTDYVANLFPSLRMHHLQHHFCDDGNLMDHYCHHRYCSDGNR